MIPAGMRVVLDPDLKRVEGGTVLIGGAPPRMLRVSQAGASLLDRLAAGDPVPEAGGGAVLARKMLDAGMAHPRPATAIGAPRPDQVTVVVPVLGHTAEVATTVSSLGRVGAVVVVDDGSVPAIDEATLRAISVSPLRVLRHERPQGPAAARETGWRAACLAADPPAAVAFVDAEVMAPEGGLEDLLAHLADPAVAAVAPRISPRAAREVDGPTRPTATGARSSVALRRALERYETENSPLDMGPDEANVRPGSPVGYVPTAALVVRTAALESVGGFDCSLRFGEDVDLVWRLVAAGSTVRYEPAVVMSHPVRPDLRSWVSQRVGYGSSAGPLAARHGSSVAPVSLTGWTAATWGAIAVSQPLIGAAVGLASTVALARRLRGSAPPSASGAPQARETGSDASTERRRREFIAIWETDREALRLAAKGHRWTAGALARATRRSWLPLALGGLWWRRTRTPTLVALAAPSLAALARGVRPSAVALGALDDVAYCAGVWRGSWRARTIGALLPARAGSIRPGPGA